MKYWRSQICDSLSKVLQNYHAIGRVLNMCDTLKTTGKLQTQIDIGVQVLFYLRFVTIGVF